MTEKESPRFGMLGRALEAHLTKIGTPGLETLIRGLMWPVAILIVCVGAPVYVLKEEIGWLLNRYLDERGIRAEIDRVTEALDELYMHFASLLCSLFYSPEELQAMDDDGTADPQP